MIETTLLNYLGAKTTASVKMEMPSTYTSGPLVILEKISSNKADQIITSVFTVKIYADTLYGAAQLNEEIKDILEGCDSPDICSIRVNDGYYPDVTRKRYRYQQTVEITHY